MSDIDTLLTTDGKGKDAKREALERVARRAAVQAWDAAYKRCTGGIGAMMRPAAIDAAARHAMDSKE